MKTKIRIKSIINHIEAFLKLVFMLLSRVYIDFSGFFIYAFSVFCVLEKIIV